ncbi:MAG: nucleotidyltransferase domain-containing protein [Bacteroidota bacterium]|nr:nucleotidyltransferase domain-containing protein [Bacteroidota bacterium]
MINIQKFGLEIDVIENINSIISSFNEIDEAVLFGSRVKGSFKIGSDIDVALKGKDLNTATLNKIYDRLEELYLPYTIDLCIFDNIDNIDMLNSINNTGQVLFKRQKS